MTIGLALNLMFLLFFYPVPEGKVPETNTTYHSETVKKPVLKHKIDSAAIYVKEHGLNDELAILINYHLHSGLKRGYLINLKKNLAFDSFTVSHGCGNLPWGKTLSKDQPVFSNESGSHCSSLGHYRMGSKGRSDWGTGVKYLMHGLDKSNNRAFERFIVLHGWESISEQEVHPEGVPEGWGCPAVSNKTMQTLDSLLTRHKEVLLWAY